MLAEIEGTPFFEALLQHTREGLFADPVHGGNRGMLGWRLLGHPGAQRGYGPRPTSPDARSTARRAACATGLPGERAAGRLHHRPRRGRRGRSLRAGRGRRAGPRRSRPARHRRRPTRGRTSCWRRTRGPATAPSSTRSCRAGGRARGRGDPGRLLARPDGQRRRRLDPDLRDLAAPLPAPRLRDPLEHARALRPGRAAARPTVVDWPLSYDDLEPYYGRVERMMGVAGLPGNVRGEPVPDGNPFEPYRSEPLPLPPVRQTATGALFTAAARRLGYHPFPVPVSVNSQPYAGRPACTYCGWCTFYVCHNDSKTTAGQLVRARGARDRQPRGADRLPGRADQPRRGRVAQRRLPRRRRRAGQRSGARASSWRPTRSRTCGCSGPPGSAWPTASSARYFMTKMYAPILALFRGRRLNRFAGAGHQGTIMDDFVGDNFDHAGLGFVRGATISCEEQLQPIGAARMPPPPGVPRWGAAYKRHLLENWNSIADLRIQPETLPYQDTFLDLDPRVRDRSGGRAAGHADHLGHAPERAAHGRLPRGARARIAAEMGADQVWAGRASPAPAAPTTSAAAGMGDRPGRLGRRPGAARCTRPRTST